MPITAECKKTTLPFNFQKYQIIPKRSNPFRKIVLMDFITPQNRQQITFSSPEDKIAAENPVRFLEAFVVHLELKKLSFIVPELKTEGQINFELNGLERSAYSRLQIKISIKQ